MKGSLLQFASYFQLFHYVNIMIMLVLNSMLFFCCYIKCLATNENALVGLASSNNYSITHTYVKYNNNYQIVNYYDERVSTNDFVDHYSKTEQLHVYVTEQLQYLVSF